MTIKKIFTLLFLSVSLTVFSQNEFLGEWITVNEKNGVQESVVRIFKATDGLYYGKIEKLLAEEYATLDPVCVKCKGADAGKKVVGLLIVRGMRCEDGKLVGGNVLDPMSGNIYYGSIKFDKAKNELILRGSIDKRGILGRSQTWVKK